MYRYIVWAFFGAIFHRDIMAAQPVAATNKFYAALRNQVDTDRDTRDGDNWKCHDGSYISMEARCDGVLDCKDYSDESHALCWKRYCPPSRFRCAYGACVDSTAPCNGVEECADGSDELLPRCRNNEKSIHNGQFTCYDGEMIEASELCDGVKNCVDGSDESLAYCAGRRCAPNQFQCKYGACVNPRSNCDENQNQDCADASDESDELCNRNTTTPSIVTGAKEVIRPCDGFRCNDGTCLLKEQLCNAIAECSLAEDEVGCKDLNVKCSDDQWACRDGSCIAKHAQCDGKLDCPDFSDETHALCRKHDCPPSRFRCTYGACVDATAPCNNIQDCADYSDELLPTCRNETLVVNAKFTCFEDGEKIPAEDLCDGIKNCADGSDENLASCAALRCASHQFQCAYGACVDPNSECEENRKQDCADGSDESDELCNRITVAKVLPKCVLPPYPEHGSYTVAGRDDTQPGQAFDSVALTVDCETTYRPDDLVDIRCDDGVWSRPLPWCKRICALPRHRSVTYYCGEQECNELVSSGTEVRPVCKNLYTTYGRQPVNMTCILNTWTDIAICHLEFVASTFVDSNNLVLSIGGENIQVHLSGAEYMVTLKDGDETIFTESMPRKKEMPGPNEKVTDDTVVVIEPRTSTSKPDIKPSPHFHPRYVEPHH